MRPLSYALMALALIFAMLPVGAAPPGYRTISTGKGSTQMSAVGYDKLKALQFFDYLSEEARKNINTFDRLSTGLDMTIEDFFTFINKLLEDGVPDAQEPVQDDFLSVAQLGQLFGNVNETAVHYILNNLGVGIKELHGAFDTVDVIMVLMFVSSHFEAGGLDLSILDIIKGFCHNGQMEADHWVNNVAASKRVQATKVARLVSQLEGGIFDIRTYVTEIVRPDTCYLVKPVPDAALPDRQLSAPRVSSGLRGARVAI